MVTSAGKHSPLRRRPVMVATLLGQAAILALVPLAAGAGVLEISPGQLKIGMGEGHHLRYLQDADNFSALKSLANQFFEREVALSIATVAVPAATSEAEREAVLAEGEQTSEMAKEVLRIFGGSVKGIRKESR
jgi:hypothetical protein